MGHLFAARRRAIDIDDPKYQQEIAAGLGRAYREAARSPHSFRLGTDRMVIVSDVHKGARNAADDFRHCEQAFNAALAYYYALGYWLVELGDLEELWEERAGTVIGKYERTLQLSAKFHVDPDRRGSRYTRLWGNHDDQWSRRDEVEKFLAPIYCPAGAPALEVHGSVIVPVVDDAGFPRGKIFLAHGHQGTFESDKASWLSRLAVRYLWRPFQRLTKISLNTPRKDWRLRERHDRAMHRWATSLDCNDLVFIAGHTHRPIFLSESRSDELVAEIGQVETMLREDAARRDLLPHLAELAAQLEWTRAGGQEVTGPNGSAGRQKACYFNPGCAAYQDGDVTALELAGDEIRLVRWPDDKGDARPQTLDSMALSLLFGGVGAGV